MCPSCSAPMVGTKPIVFSDPVGREDRSLERAERRSGIVEAMFGLGGMAKEVRVGYETITELRNRGSAGYGPIDHEESKQ